MRPSSGIGTKKNTGSDLAYEVNNIFDMAGNVREWTLEAVSTDIRVPHGGLFRISGSTGPASYRTGINPTYTDDTLGSRATLYVNQNTD